MNVSLPESMKSWVDEQIAEGGYGSASDYIRSLIRDAQQKKARDRIDENLLSALGSGESQPMDAEEWKRIRRAARARIARRKRG